MQTSPLVTIGIPTYNRPIELGKCLDQLLGQTYTHIEFVIVDNASTNPEVKRTIEKYTKKYPNIRYFLNATNLGVLENANKALRLANGEYFCWVSDDDWRSPEFIDFLVNALEANPEVNMAFCDYVEVSPEGERAKGYPHKHLELFQSFQSSSQLIRCIRYFFQDERLGKQNLFYSVFRTKALKQLDLHLLSAGFTQLSMDKMIVYRMLQQTRAIILPELLCTLTCGNDKHYGEKVGKSIRSSTLTSLLKFIKVQIYDLYQHIRHAPDFLMASLALCIFPIKIITVFIRRLAIYLSIGAWLDKLLKRSLYSDPDLGDLSIAPLELPQITLIALATRDVEQTLAAIEHSRKNIKFGAVRLLSHYTPFGLPADVDFIRIKKNKDIDEWSFNVVYELGQYVDTDFALLIHADGFVVNPSAWRPEFLEYDYIGAPWPLPKDNYSYRDVYGNVIRVGNSVSIRSKRLLDLPKTISLLWEADNGFFNEDGFICVKNHHIFNSYGMKFADIQVAKYFSHETMIPEIKGIKPFAFHKWAGSNSIYPRFD
jgi:glycosyltransferase involved in cell wall biosynthesis